MDHLSIAKNSRIAAIPTPAKKVPFPPLKLSPPLFCPDPHYDVTGFLYLTSSNSGCVLGHTSEEETAEASKQVICKRDSHQQRGEEQRSWPVFSPARGSYTYCLQ